MVLYFLKCGSSKFDVALDTKNDVIIITTFNPAFVRGLVPSLAMAPALGPYFCVRYWMRGIPASGVVGFRKKGFHVTTNDKSLENTFMASSRWRFPTKHLKENKGIWSFYLTKVWQTRSSTNKKQLDANLFKTQCSLTLLCSVGILRPWESKLKVYHQM